MSSMMAPYTSYLHFASETKAILVLLRAISDHRLCFMAVVTSVFTVCGLFHIQPRLMNTNAITIGKTVVSHLKLVDLVPSLLTVLSCFDKAYDE